MWTFVEIIDIFHVHVLNVLNVCTRAGELQGKYNLATSAF